MIATLTRISPYDVPTRQEALRRAKEIVDRQFFVVDHDGNVLDHIGGFDSYGACMDKALSCVMVGGPNWVREFFVLRDGTVGDETCDSRGGLLSGPAVLR